MTEFNLGCLGLHMDAMISTCAVPLRAAVTKFNLDCLGLCPCLVDIEIVDTRNGNESQMVTAGPGACSCSSPSRKVRCAVPRCGAIWGGVWAREHGLAQRAPAVLRCALVEWCGVVGCGVLLGRGVGRDVHFSKVWCGAHARVRGLRGGVL